MSTDQSAVLIAEETPALLAILKTPDERKAALGRNIATQLARGFRVDSQSEYQAVLVTGHRVNHVLHGLLTLFTVVWGFVWIYVAATGGEERILVEVDQYGTVSVAKL